MEKSLTINQISSYPEIIEILDWPFDFNLLGRISEFDWFRLKNGQKHKNIATDGAGNVFAFYGNSLDAPILYVCHEGQSGIIALNLYEAIQIFISAPYWRDLLKFSGNGILNEMKRAVPLLEQKLHEDFPELNEQKEKVINTLKVDMLLDPVTKLHTNVKNNEIEGIVVTDENYEFEPLFNTFTVDDNPMWQNK